MSLNKFANSEAELRRVGGVNAPVGSRDPVHNHIISCAVELLRLVTSDDIMTSLLNKLSISIKTHAVNWVSAISFQIVECQPNPSAVVVSYSCEFMCTPLTPTRRNSTVESCRRRRCVLNSQLAHDDCRRMRSHRRHDATRLRCWQLSLFRLVETVAN